MSHLLTLSELSLDDIQNLLHEAERFRQGASFASSKPFLWRTCFLNRAQEQNVALK